MNTLKKFIAKAGAVVAGVVMPVAAMAQTGFQQSQQLLGQVAGQSGLGSGGPNSLTLLIGAIINAVLGFIGVVLLFYLLYAGFLWMTAGGDEKNVTKAKDMIKNAIIGLIILVASVAISSFVINMLTQAVSKT